MIKQICGSVSGMCQVGGVMSQLVDDYKTSSGRMGVIQKLEAMDSDMDDNLWKELLHMRANPHGTWADGGRPDRLAKAIDDIVAGHPDVPAQFKPLARVDTPTP